MMTTLSAWTIRVLLGLLLLIVVLVATILLIQPRLDLTSHRETVAQFLSTAVGREVRFGGDLLVALGRDVNLSVSDLSVANPAWAESAKLLRAAEASVGIDLFAILSGVIRLHGVVLRDAEAVMEVSADGAHSWDLGAPSIVEEVEAGWRLVIEDAHAENVSLRYRGPAAARPIELRIARFHQENDAGMLLLDATATANELPIQLRGRIGPLQSLIAGRDIDVDLRAELDKTVASVRGRFGDPQHLEDIETEATVRGESLANLLNALGVKSPIDRDIDLSFKVSDRERGFSWESRGHVGDLMLDMRGEVARPLELNDLRLSIRANGKNLGLLGRLFRVPALPQQAYRLQGEIVRDKDGLALSDANLTTGETRLMLSGRLPEFPGFEKSSARLDVVTPEGEITAELSGEHRDRPYVDLVATARGFDFSRLLASELVPEDLAPDGPDAAAGSRAIPDTPLSLGWLDAMDGRLRITGEALSYPDPAFADKHLVRSLQLDANLAQGGLVLPKLRVSGDRGVVEIKGALSRTAQGVKAEGTLKASDIRYGILARGNALEQLPKHQVDMRLTADGKTYRELATSLRGSALLTGGSGRVANAGIDEALGDFLGELLGTINPWSKKQPFTEIVCTAAALQVSNGIIELDPGFVTRTEKLDIAAAGTIDLNTERIDVQFKNTPRGGLLGLSAGGMVNRFVKVGGTLSAPDLVLDSGGALVSGTAVAATGGISLIVTSLLDRISSATGDPCAQIVAAAGTAAGTSPAGSPPAAPASDSD